MTVEILRVASYADLSVRAAEIVTELLASDPEAAVVPATGATPMGLYEELARKAAGGALDASGIRVFQLDEYVGVSPEARRSLYGWMDARFLQPLGVPESRVVRLNGMAPDLAAACREYDSRLASAGGPQLAILGLGPNGHLGYNEPPSPRDAPTREVLLTAESSAAAAAYFGGLEVPRRALTAGMSRLLDARRILLLVSGAHKRDILRRALFGPIGPEVPASWLQTIPGVTVIADAAALAG